ncbi:MAG: cytochrome c class I [Chloroflexi bacterium OLB15]|nr:MAG: cytochrome c class I [Chloroflexi bacterium OLB15]
MNRKTLISPPVLLVLVMLAAITVVFVIVLLTSSNETDPGMTPDDYNARGAELVAMGNSENGAQLIVSKTCTACHRDEAGSVGPSFTGIVDYAGTLRPGFTAEGYLLESILDPGVYLYNNYSNSMPALGTQLSDQELADIMAYLMTQHAQ